MNMRPHIPDLLPLENLNLNGMIADIGKANRAFASFGGLLMGVPNPYVLLSPLTSQEAVLSSKIEGTQASLQELLKYEAGDLSVSSSKAIDIEEILNYREAMTAAIHEMKVRPITLNLLKNLHAILLKGVRGENLRRGDFRKNQNYIGKPGCKIEQATFIPPAPESLIDWLDNWEKYVHSNEVDPLIQLAIVHAQFEIIHPFMDGNGRIGRMLIPLFLYEKKLIPYPTFYISAYLEANREEYYARLGAISKEGDWEGWIRFFLNAITEESEKNSRKAHEILELYEEMKGQFIEWTKSQYASFALDMLFRQPIISATDFKDRAGMPRPTAARIFKILSSKKVFELLRPARGQMASIVAFTRLLDIVER
ncbi:MAG: hypothetical protein S4CHLAM102_11360 [Chlamydiia bacterium]|nr:hypothetical protein [Chlamydiia bacterium]